MPAQLLTASARAVTGAAALVRAAASLPLTSAAARVRASVISAGPPWWVIPKAMAVTAARANVGTPVPSLDPLAIFTAPPALDPRALIDDVPPYERDAYEVQAVLKVVANELARIEAARQALITNFFPLTADALLPLFEQLLGLPVAPANTTLDTRHQLVAAYMQRLKSEGRGLDWMDGISQTVGTQNWNYQEHDPANSSSPPAYTVNVNIPQAAAGYGWPLIRDLTPAHLAIVEGYTGGFVIGTSVIGSNL